MAGEVTVGKGVIPIRADTKPLEKGLREASQAVSRLTGRGAIGSIGGLSGAVVHLGQSFSTMAGTANAAISGIGNAFSALAKGGLSGIGGALAGIVSTVGQAVSSTISAVGDLASAGVKAIGGLAASAASLVPHVGEAIATAVSGVTGLLSALVQAASKVIAGLVSVVTTAITTAIRAVADLVSAAAAALGRILQAVADAALKVGGAVAAAGAAIGFGLYKAVRAASDLNETISKVGVVFGAATGIVTKGADEMAKSLGVPRREFLDAVSSIGLIAKASNLGTKAAADLSLKLARLGADAASFYNVPIQEALVSMRAGLVGESEPLRRFGVLLNEDAVANEAMRLGLARTTKGLTEAIKVQARASLIIRGMTDASGDLARTQDALANRMREVGGRFSTLMETIGSAFLPAAQAIAGGLGKVLGEVTTWVEENKGLFAGFAGFLEGVGNAIGNVFQKWPVFLELARSAFADVVANVKAGFAVVSEAVSALIPKVQAALGALGQLLAAQLVTAKGAALGALADLQTTLGDKMADMAEHMANRFGETLKANLVPILSAGTAQGMLDMINRMLLSKEQREKVRNLAFPGNAGGGGGAAPAGQVQEAAGRVDPVFGRRIPGAKPGAVREASGRFDPVFGRWIPGPGRPRPDAAGGFGTQLGAIGQALSGAAGGAMNAFGGIGGAFGPSARTRDLLGQVSATPAFVGPPKLAPKSAIETLNAQNQQRTMAAARPPSLPAISLAGLPGFSAPHAGAPMRGPLRRTAADLEIERLRGLPARPQSQLPPGPLRRSTSDFTPFGGSEAQAAKILKTRAGKGGAGGGASALETLEDMNAELGLPAFTGGEADAAKILRTRARKGGGRGGRGGPMMPETLPNFKSEFVGLEDFAKKIQMGIGGGGKDFAKDTADNTKSALDIWSDIKQNGIKVQGGGTSVAVAG